MQKTKLLFLILSFVGVTLLAISWLQSYPLLMTSSLDFVYDHISTFYWLGLPILYVALYALLLKLRNKIAVLVVLFAVILAMQSLVYFYQRIPGSDSQSIRGLTEYLSKTGDLNPSRRGSYYLQWPSFFILEEMTSLIPGIGLPAVEFSLFTVILFLYVASLYVFAARHDSGNAHLLVIGFFIVTPVIFEFQLVPLFISVSILFVMFLLQSMALSRETTILTLILFVGITLTHPLVPIFFVLYTLMRTVENASRESFLRLLLGELTIYFVLSTAFAPTFFVQSVQNISNMLSSTYGTILDRTLTVARVAPRPFLDIIAQTFSRTVTIGTVSVLGIGLAILLIKKRLKITDLAILSAGSIYAIVGFVFPILGERSLIMLAVILSLGGVYYATKYSKLFKIALLSFLLLFTFIQISSSFFDSQTVFQTRSEYQSANFLLENVKLVNYPNEPLVILSHFRTVTYLYAKGGGDTQYKNDFSRDFPASLNTSDYFLFTIGLEKSFLRLNISGEVSDQVWASFNIIENTGSTILASNLKMSK